MFFPSWLKLPTALQDMKSYGNIQRKMKLFFSDRDSLQFFNNPYITIRDTVVVTELHVLTAWYTLRKKHTSLAKVHLSTLPFTIHRKCLNWLHSSTTNGHSHSTHHISVKYKLWHTFDPPLQVQISSYQIKPILENFHLQIMGLNWYQVKPNQT